MAQNLARIPWKDMRSSTRFLLRCRRCHSTSTIEHVDLDRSLPTIAYVGNQGNWNQPGTQWLLSVAFRRSVAGRHCVWRLRPLRHPPRDNPRGWSSARHVCQCILVAHARRRSASRPLHVSTSRSLVCVDVVFGTDPCRRSVAQSMISCGLDREHPRDRSAMGQRESTRADVRMNRHATVECVECPVRQGRTICRRRSQTSDTKKGTP